MTGSSNDAWEDGAGRIITSEAGLAHTGSIVNNKSSNFLVAHF
jgi:hypothetical protein